MDPLLVLLIVIAPIVVLSEPPEKIFNVLTSEETQRLQNNCGYISPPSQRKIFNGTIVPATESIFTVNVHKGEMIESGILVSTRHVIGAYNNETIIKKEFCMGKHYVLSGKEVESMSISVNEQDEDSEVVNVKVKTAMALYACDPHADAKIWIYELEKDLPETKMHRPICLLNNTNLLNDANNMELYAVGLSHVKNRVVQEKINITRAPCPGSLGKDILCAYPSEPFCRDDFGSSVVVKIENRNFLAGIAQYPSSFTESDNKECKRGFIGSDEMLISFKVEDLFYEFCYWFRLCLFPSTANYIEYIKKSETRSTTENPTTYSEQPTTYSEQTTTYDEQPTTYSDQPTIYTEEPTTYSDQPTTYPPEKIIVNSPKPILIGTPSCNATSTTGAKPKRLVLEAIVEIQLIRHGKKKQH